MSNDRTESPNLNLQKMNTPKWPRKSPFAPSILVMKGGGVKGIAYVGALQTLEKYGYQFNHFIGTSAGAISAALLAVGYTSQELGEILKKTDFHKFKDGWLLTSILLLPFRKGLYRGEEFRIWLEGNLGEKFPQYSQTIAIRFKHLNEIESGSRRLSVFASTKGRTAYFFDSLDLAKAEHEISFACRCSMAIPYFFIPEKIDGQWVVDGGMQNNYPINAILDKYPGLKDSSDFVGLYLGRKKLQRNSKWLFSDLFSIWSESGDEEAKEYFIDRTIVIDPRPVKTTDFSLSQNDVDFLLAEGEASALSWLFYWTEGKRPTKEEVKAAELRSKQLREQVIKDRWKKFWPKLLIIVFVLTLLVFSSVFLLYILPAIGEHPSNPAVRPPLPPAGEGAGRLPIPKYTPCEFGSRVGHIEFKNSSHYPITVKLWHSHNTNRHFREWVISAGETKKLFEDDSRGYGDDWGVQIGDSEIKCVGKAAYDWDNDKRTFFISSDSFYSTRR